MQSTGYPIVKRMFGSTITAILCAALISLMQPVSTIALEDEKGAVSTVVRENEGDPASTSALEGDADSVSLSALTSEVDPAPAAGGETDSLSAAAQDAQDSQASSDEPEPADVVTTKAPDASPAQTETAASSEGLSSSSSVPTSSVPAAVSRATAPTGASVVRISGDGTEEDPYVFEVSDVPAADGTVTQPIDKTLLDESWAERGVYVMIGDQRFFAPASSSTIPTQDYKLGETYRAYVLEDVFDNENEPTALTVPANTVMIKNLGGYDKQDGVIVLYDREAYYKDGAWEKVQQGETYEYDGNDFQWFFSSVLERGYLIFTAYGMAGGPTAYAYEQDSEYVLVDVDLHKLMPSYFNEQGQYASNAGWIDYDELLEMQDFLFVSGSVITLVTPDENGHAQVYIRRPFVQETGNQSVGMYGVGHGGAFLTTSAIQVSRYFKLVSASVEDPDAEPVGPDETPTAPGEDAPKGMQMISGEEQATRASEPAVVQASSRTEQQASVRTEEPVESAVPRTDDTTGSMSSVAPIGVAGLLLLMYAFALRRGNRSA